MKIEMGHKMEMKVCVCFVFVCFLFVFFVSPCAGFCSAQLSLFLTKHSKLNHIEHLMSTFGSMQIINSE